jgi:hypothetical protein
MSSLGDQLGALTAQIEAQLDADVLTISALQAEIDALKAKYEPPPMPLLAGLSSINMSKPAVYPELGAYILNVYWSQLQAAPGGSLLPGNPIDAALAGGKPFRVRLSRSTLYRYDAAMPF